MPAGRCRMSNTLYKYEFTADECRVILTALEMRIHEAITPEADRVTAENLVDYLETVSGLRHES